MCSYLRIEPHFKNGFPYSYFEMVDATAAIRETKLIEEEVECRPEKTSSDLDENVDVCHYFSADAWMVVVQDVMSAVCAA